MALRDYFQNIDERIAAKTGKGDTSFQIRIGDQVIEQRFTTEEQAAGVKPYFVGTILKEKEEPDSILYFWTDDIDEYLPQGTKNINAVWRSQDDTGYLRITPGYELSGIDYQRNIFYYCRHPESNPEFMLYGHAMVVMLGQWARQNGMMLLHSACVGVNGKGIMLSARGGGGKSTLAVSCLLNGFDFVSDDYILVNREGPLKAMPLYRTVSLNQDMASVLKPDLPVIHIDHDRNDKLMMDASSYEFKDKLPVHAIIYPSLTDNDLPSVRETVRGPVLVKLIDSTASQLGVFRDPEAYREMSQRLLNVPVYEIRLCKNLEKNVQCLKNFICEEI